MSRFVLTTFLAVIAFFAIGLSLHGATRLWAFTAFWTVYLTIVGCGIAFIQLQFFGPVICHGDRNSKRVFLTFDDGPHPTITPALLDLLQRENVAATFFCIGENVDAHPQIAARIVGEGHLIANHTYHHSRWTAFMGSRQLQHEMQLAQQAIRNATGIVPIYMRPPVGLTNPHYARVLKGLGLQMIGWDVRSLDTLKSSKQVIDRVMRKARGGSIILLHDGGKSPEHILQIVDELLTQLRSRGFEFKRVDDLV